jgi:hypothetical protein
MQESDFGHCLSPSIIFQGFSADNTKVWTCITVEVFYRNSFMISKLFTQPMEALVLPDTTMNVMISQLTIIGRHTQNSNFKGIQNP